jgi:hypothetical protein
MSDMKKETIQLEEPLSSEVLAFCALLARIMVRCLREKNPQVMQCLSQPSQSEELETGETYDAA